MRLLALACCSTLLIGIGIGLTLHRALLRTLFRAEDTLQQLLLLGGLLLLGLGLLLATRERSFAPGPDRTLPRPVRSVGTRSVNGARSDASPAARWRPPE